MVKFTMMKLEQKPLLILLAVLVLLINAIVLFKVFDNRQEVVATVTLTERELALPYGYDSSVDNSGLALNFDFRLGLAVDENGVKVQYRPRWLNRDKMLSLGFTPAELEHKNVTGKPRRVVFVAIENDGRRYQYFLQQLTQWRIDKKQQAQDKQDSIDNIEKKFKREKFMGSRLTVFDAANSLEALVERYGNENSVFYAKAIVSPLRGGKRYFNDEEKGFGLVEQLEVEKLNVPYPYNKALKALPREKWDTIVESRYEVELSYGKNLEPWISEVRLIDLSGS